jgi:hypothetical protein
MVKAKLLDRLTDRRRLDSIEPDARKALRVEAGATLAGMGDSMRPRVTSTAIFHWERGERTPRGDHLRQYLALLDEFERIL